MRGTISTVSKTQDCPLEVNSCRAGSKGITMFNLFRANFLESKGAASNAQFGTNFQEKKQKDYVEQWNLVKSILDRDDPYKVQDLVECLLNGEAAQKLGDRGEFPVRPGQITSVASVRRPRFDAEEEARKRLRTE